MQRHLSAQYVTSECVRREIVDPRTAPLREAGQKIGKSCESMLQSWSTTTFIPTLNLWLWRENLKSFYRTMEIRFHDSDLVSKQWIDKINMFAFIFLYLTSPSILADNFRTDYLQWMELEADFGSKIVPQIYDVHKGRNEHYLYRKSKNNWYPFCKAYVNPNWNH